MKVGFIGVGAMAKAIIRGMVRANLVPSADILVHSAHKENYETFATELSLTPVATNKQLAADSDILVLAVVPGVVKQVITEIDGSISKETTVVSIVSGLSLSRIEELTSYNQPILRTLPNVNSAYGQGMTAVIANENLTGNSLKQALSIFESTGQTIELPESQFANFSAISGSAVAYVDFFIDALSRAGVKYGFTKEVATKIATQTTLGSASSLLESGKSPAEVIDEVCSPGGDTIAGILAMEEKGFLPAVVHGIDATIKKSTGN
ncbi:pyrroline-5-carboxylate reductase [Lentilactobacillus sp. Marseille-Q4993]|uniref:pyrroline-5-carboxylate reductase n=1 Tax=Lentilactobacillus sp. Marseille-Q4993 TaxID=3039492 RepID=UPI0024BCE149|nr:pyrroline-5-carboxylate reductase [Lentilactobacillus sp. Marseille-Q4993]